nr:unnamed protein product [Callosobruchus analis]
MNYKDRQDSCLFCEKDVLHFARHIIKWHEQEFEYRKTDATLRPVKRSQSTDKFGHSDDFLPCKYCLGYYKKKSLFRHTKKCPLNYDQNCHKKQTSQSDGQTTLLLHSVYKHDEL